MFFKFKKDQKCKNFLFWAKTVKVAKMGVLTEKTSFWKDLSCLQSKFGLKMSFQQVMILKCQEKWFKD